MAAKKKKPKKATRKKLRNLAIKRGRKSAFKRGRGLGSRKEFNLPAMWQEIPYESGNKSRVKFTSPGKSVYRAQNTVKKRLLELGMTACLDESSENTTSTEEGSTFLSLDEEECKDEVVDINAVNKEERLFVCQSSQLMDLVDQVNITSRCNTANCEGKIQ